MGTKLSCDGAKEYSSLQAYPQWGFLSSPKTASFTPAPQHTPPIMVKPYTTEPPKGHQQNSFRPSLGSCIGMNTSLLCTRKCQNTWPLINARPCIGGIYQSAVLRLPSGSEFLFWQLRRRLSPICTNWTTASHCSADVQHRLLRGRIVRAQIQYSTLDRSAAEKSN